MNPGHRLNPGTEVKPQNRGQALGQRLSSETEDEPRDRGRAQDWHPGQAPARGTDSRS